jgi:hypothetical protein
MIDPVVHAALVTVAAFLINLLFKALGLDLGGEIATQLAQVIVAYILSLFGYGLWLKATATKAALANDRWYTPPFTK